MFQGRSTGFLLLGGTNEKAMLKSSIIPVHCSITPRRLTFFFPIGFVLSRHFTWENKQLLLWEENVNCFQAAAYFFICIYHAVSAVTTWRPDPVKMPERAYTKTDIWFIKTYPWPWGYNVFNAQLNWAWNLSCSKMLKKCWYFNILSRIYI